MAIFFPERVKKLILVDCVPPDVLDKVKNNLFRTLVAIKDIPLLPYLVLGSRNKNSIKWVLQECLFDIKLITPEILDRQYQFSKIKGTTWVLHSTFKHAKDAKKLRDLLSRVDHPTFIIRGKGDLIFPPAVGKAIHQAIKGSKFQVIEKGGHIPMWETPDEVNQAILSFLRG